MEGLSTSVRGVDYECEENANGTIIILGYVGADVAVTIPSILSSKSVVGIATEAFSFTDVESVITPDSVKSIESEVFSGCRKLTTVTIGSGVTDIGESIFRNCSSLKSISVSILNANYSAGSGVLFDKTQTTLMTYPAGKTDTAYSVPNTVKTISNAAFYACPNLESVTMPDGLTRIGDRAFAGNDNLTIVNIPGSVATIGDGAFENCKNLDEAYFEGDAPANFGDNVFGGAHDGFAIHYPIYADGWDTPEWRGYSAEPYGDAPILITGYTFTAYGPPEGYSINHDNGRIYGVGAGGGSYYVIIMATGIDGSEETIFAEVLINIGNVESASEEVIYKAAGLPDGLDFDPIEGNISNENVAIAVGTYEFAVCRTDPDDESKAFAVVTLTVEQDESDMQESIVANTDELIDPVEPDEGDESQTDDKLTDDDESDDDDYDDDEAGVGNGADLTENGGDGKAKTDAEPPDDGADGDDGEIQTDDKLPDDEDEMGTDAETESYGDEDGDTQNDS